MVIQHPLVRDLAWVIRSPALTHDAIGTDWCEQEYHKAEGWLATLEKDPSPLEQRIKTITRRGLGTYFETLVLFWLEHRADTRVIASNVQVQEENRTLGELDILFEEAGQYFHWEVAVKFYLKHPDAGRYYGPKGRDRLDLKMTKLEQQAGLSTQEVCRPVLEELGIPQPQLQPRIFLKGILFYPYKEYCSGPHCHSEQSEESPEKAVISFTGVQDDMIKRQPDFVTQEHLKGWWIEQREMKYLNADSEWMILHKPHWFVPVSAERGLTLPGLIKQARAIENTMLVAEIREGREISRGFIVPDGWGKKFTQPAAFQS